MTFDQLWRSLVARNPGLGNVNAKVAITSDQFRKALSQAYEQGRRSASCESPPIHDLFNDIFHPFGKPRA